MADIRYYDVILKPVVTEKSMDIMADKKSIGNIRRQSLDMKLFNALRATVSLDEKNVSVEEFEALFSEK